MIVECILVRSRCSLIGFMWAGSDALSNPSDKELITTTNRISPSNRNADALTDNSTTQGDKNNHLVEAPNPSSLEHLALKDEGNMLDRPLQPSLLNAGSSQCPTERSIPSHLVVSQIPELQLPFDKESHFWSIIEEYDVFKNLPQQPHFLPLRDTLPGLREGTAFGLMKSFATIAESTRKLSIKDSLQTFHEKIDALLYLEEHGFSVQELLNCLNKLLQIKSDYTKKREDKCKLNLQIFHKASSVAHMQSLLDENEKSIAELEMKLAQLRLDAHNMSQEIENDESELSRIEDASNHFRKHVMMKNTSFTAFWLSCNRSF